MNFYVIVEGKKLYIDDYVESYDTTEVDEE
jgi:hypothetical protein